MMLRDHIIAVVVAIVALVLQLVIAPYITLFGAMPNFIVVYVLVLAIVRCDSFGCVLPFVMGLIYDIVSGGPVGAMAFSLLLFSYIVSRVFVNVDNDTLFMPLLTMAVSLLLVEVSYTIFLLLLGYDASLFQVLIYRTMPCYLYDLVVALVLYPLLMRLLPATAPVRSDLTQLR